LLDPHFDKDKITGVDYLGVMGDPGMREKEAVLPATQ
jgi:hypothetical protein